MHVDTMPDVGGGWEDVRRAAADRESGAAEITRRAAATLASLPASDLLEAVRTLIRAHPSMAPLWRLGHAVLSATDHAGAAAAFASRLARERAAVASAAAPLLHAEVVTHSYSSTLVAVVASAGAPARCARSDPGGEGRLTASSLAAAGGTARVVEDHEAVVAARKGATVVTGADAVGPGGVVNKVGTGRLAEAARDGGGRWIVVAGGTKLLAADLPAPLPFQRVPLDLATAIVTEDGPLAPEVAAARATRYAVHPALADLLR
jgi:translation initiation factor 2B subunit (eIF-2B alpha/beta/delta family)